MTIRPPLLAVVVLSCVAAAPARAQCEPAWSQSFGTFTLEGAIETSAVFDDGSGPALYVGGDFTAIDGHAASRIARWRAGDGWTALGSGITGPPFVGGMDAHVHALAVFDDGSGPALFVAGEFDHAGGVPCSSIARWKNGVWSDVGGGLSGVQHDTRAHSLCVHDDGSGAALYVGGNFTGAGGIVASKIARWNGSSWSALAGGIEGEQGHTVYALASYGGALYAGGAFFTASGVSTLSIARWSGVAWENTGDVAGIVYALATFDDGTGLKLYAGGEFSWIDGPAPRIARFDGTAWSAPASGPNNTVQALAPFGTGSNADLYIGGLFSGVGGLPTGSVVRWNGGNLATVPYGPGTSVRTLSVLADADGVRLFAGSSGFSSGSGALAFDGATWRALTEKVGAFGYDASFNGRRVEALQAIDHGGALGRFIYAGGTFNGAFQTPSSRHLARFDGAHWSAIGDVTAGPGISDVGVHALTTYDDGSGSRLVVAGRFSAIGGAPVRSIALFDGTAVSALGGGLSLFAQPATVNHVATYDDGSGQKLFAIGSIDSAGGTPVNDIACWNGSSWIDVSFSSANILLYDLFAFDDGGGSKLYVGGYVPNGSPDETLVLRFDGSTWEDVSAGLPAHDTPSVFAAFDDGSGPRLYVATQSGHVHAWNGSAWSSVTGVNGAVYAMCAHDDGSGEALYLGGSFSAGSSAMNLARWNGATLSAAHGSPDTAVYALAAFDSGLYAGGPFNWIQTTSGASIASHAFARLASPCPPSGSAFCSGDGTATACPCGNAGAGGSGCASSFDAGGARLVASGVPRVADDTLRLDATSVSNSVVTFIQGTSAQNGGQGAVFGDGLRCVGGTLIRLGTVLASGNAASYPAAGQAPVSVRGAIPLLGGVTRTYQVWYRNSGSFCTPSTFNLTNGVLTHWAP